ncbi:hypothetical protein DHEL01_v203205 [Diaporthe helianthi]|uniref:Uncharacterized protein n=1 Tax=Diaporthe helianthi TaxID=158607 RepID=A0A2P5I7D1_DIAHE|nr:hypothetical protein DHEL01_v203205 [Diaporthe helianthi]
MKQKWRSSLGLADIPARVSYDDEQDEDEQEDELADFQPMWYRRSPHPTGCGCCIEGTGFPRPPSSVLGGSDYSGHHHHHRKTSRASTHISTSSADSEGNSGPGAIKDHGVAAGGSEFASVSDSALRLRRSVSSFGLRMKKSIGSLNRRPSGKLR